MTSQDDRHITKDTKVVGMRLKTLGYIAVKNLIFKRLRTALTTTGVVIGIGAIIFLVSFAVGLKNTVNDQIVDSESIKTIDVTSPDSKVVHLDDENISRIGKYSHVTEVSKTFILPARASLANSTTDAVTYAVDSKYLKLVSPKILAGTISIDTAKAEDGIVNIALLETVGISDASKAVGSKLKATLDIIDAEASKRSVEKTVTIRGVIDIGGGPQLYISSLIVEQAGSSSYSQVKVVVDDQNSIKNIRGQIESLGFITQSPIDTLDQVNHLFSIFAYILAGFGGIGMVIAILGMFNTLTISLLERTQEIGLMMSIGARRRDVKRLFMAEALTLSLAGGVGGVVGAWSLGMIINIFITSLANKRGFPGNVSLFAVPLWLVGLILLFVMLVGYLVVFIPSRRAARINPIDALRHE